eukprot:TRINITY_DN64264_c0_g1_i1.p1 TRINITY_DN64264_c0_g1~~TRINITY_DN64264_c0_g1_i1.p1  ORF type:complete len:619 (+),score=101.77 TRINITY_DN64264_c0_g1_i1:67-1857(+)
MEPLARINSSSVVALETQIKNTEASADTAKLYNYGGGMPASIQSLLASKWNENCDRDGSTRRGLSLIGKTLEDGAHSVTYAAPCPEDLRKIEKSREVARLNLNVDQINEFHLAFYFDKRTFVRSEAMFNLLITVFVCFALCTASIMFTNDANRLVLYPVENMISKVETIRDNPLIAMKVADEEFKAEEYRKAQREKDLKASPLKHYWEVITCSKASHDSEPMETVILEKTIIKLGSLLALGFGEAGANIIEHNMSGESASIDAMAEGSRVDCAIGAVRIRDFSTATEVLQAKVMTFVNQIAEIVHGVTNEYHGAANKNNGDTFLMIWRASEDKNISKMADMSMLGFTRILGAIHRSPVLAQYRGHPGLQQRLGASCRVNLSLGLHYGWAIEGAVGSEFKIDASYLSPNVSIAESVERATQIYGVSVLAAESVISICSPAFAAKCRLIDRVVITGSPVPMKLYVIDLDHLSLSVEPPLGPQRWTNRDRFKVRQFLEGEKEQKLNDNVHMVNIFNQNSDIAQMRFRYTLEFIHIFNMGYQNYSQGEWQVAERMLGRTKDMLGVPDGPSAAILKYMKERDFQAPASWKGIRDIGRGGIA